jgi:hypothetical protein
MVKKKMSLPVEKFLISRRPVLYIGTLAERLTVLGPQVHLLR